MSERKSNRGEACQAMGVDQLSENLIVASLVLGLLIVVIIGSQSPEDARSISLCTLVILVPLLIVSCLRLAFAPRWDRSEGGPGMVVMSILSILYVRLGYRTAKSRQFVAKVGTKDGDKQGKLEPWDDEFGV